LATLLRFWVGLQNREGDFERALAIFAGAAPEACITAIEDHTRDGEVVGDEIQDELKCVLIRRRDRPAIHPKHALVQIARATRTRKTPTFRGSKLNNPSNSPRHSVTFCLFCPAE
jgi:hypothetical protein